MGRGRGRDERRAGRKSTGDCKTDGRKWALHVAQLTPPGFRLGEHGFRGALSAAFSRAEANVARCQERRVPQAGASCAVRTPCSLCSSSLVFELRKE